MPNISEKDTKNLHRENDYEYTGSITLTSSTLSVTTAAAGRYTRYKLCTITVHASVAISETITITIDKAAGANYDVKLYEQTWFSGQDLVINGADLRLANGDEIKIASTNSAIAATTPILYCTVLFGGGT